MYKKTFAREHVKHTKYPYSVTNKERAEFIENNPCIQNFLNKYVKKVLVDGQYKKRKTASYNIKATGIACFFKWLRIVKKIELTPDQFLDLHLEKRNSNSVANRQWGLNLVLSFSRDNPDLADASAGHQSACYFAPMKLFCDANEIPLTSTNGLFGEFTQKYPEVNFTVESAKKLLGTYSPLLRTISIIQIQSGQGIQQVLDEINRDGKRIFKEIDEGKTRIRVDFPNGRKGNNFPYFSFISVDAIQEIKKWRVIRQKILDRRKIDSDFLFITRDGTPFGKNNFYEIMRTVLKREGIFLPYSIRSHGLRKLFEQEASPPIRGISKAYVAFMMGHSNGGKLLNSRLDAVGGIYDKTPFTHPEVVEAEYAKLEPYINIFSGGAAAFGKILELQTDNEQLRVQNTELKIERNAFARVDQDMKRVEEENVKLRALVSLVNDPVIQQMLKKQQQQPQEVAPLSA